MRQRNDVTQWTKVAPHALGRRLAGRVGLVAALGLLALFGSASAASANNEKHPPVLETVSPNSGCPGTPVTLTGKNFGPAGKAAAVFTAAAVPFLWPQEAQIVSNTSATTTIPIFLANGNEAGHVSLVNKEGASNGLPITLTSLNTCFKGGGGGGATGPTGPTGEKGEKGENGSPGEKGVTGATGPTGEKGEEGKTGPTGPTGSGTGSGTTGPTGPTGEKGEKGENGSPGEKGVTGATGPTGEKGEEGKTGPTGPTGGSTGSGTTGPTGPTGEKGEKGENGSPGEKGVTGATGPTGEKGEEGKTGPTGPTGGSTGSGTTGPTGPTGEKGEKGSPGEKGVTGATGPTGEKGEEGKAGPTGPTGGGGSGSTGPTGPTGEKGEKGSAGEKGVTGTTGPTGSGSTGPTGEKGATGPTGTGGGSGGEATSFGLLAKEKSETGTWAATLAMPAGGPAAQTDAAISFPITTEEITPVGNAKYLNEKEVAEPGTVPGCQGDAQEPNASPGFLCVFQGAIANVGSLATEWKEAGFFSLENAAGEKTSAGGVGELVVFRTKGFPAVPAGQVFLNAAGSWAVTAK